MLPGLTSSEARKRFQEFGPNQVVARPAFNTIALLAHQFTSPLILVLIVASLVSFFSQDLVDSVLIFLIVVLNGLFGFWQEKKAEEILSALKRMANPVSRVVRDGVEVAIPSIELVPKDVVILEQGDKVPADGRLIEATNFQVNEASLTGESVAVFKEAKEGQDQVFMGTTILNGRAKYEVTATGSNTKFGKIALQLRIIKDEETPLEKELALLGKNLGILAIGASVVTFILGLITLIGLKEMFLTSVSLAVAAVPEGLPAIVTITLAVGMQRMSRKKALIRRMSAIEALGAVEVICTDKTGTLTKNEMQVRQVWVNARSFEIGKKDIGLGDPHFTSLLKIAVNANTASLVYKKDHGSFDILGDQMEGALLLLAADSGVDPERFREKFKVEEEFSFDSALKTMSVVCSLDGKIQAYVKGAPEVLLKNSRYLLLGNRKRVLSQVMREKLKQVYEKYALRGFRVLAFGYKDLESSNLKREEVESNLVLVGFVGIADPVRTEVKEAIRVAQVAGIRTVLVTGDNELTAATVASEIGLLNEGEDVLTGAQIEKMDDQELLKVIEKVRVFARTSPENKLRIVELLQKKGYITAVTGDGVNDSLALKKADVGVAMGIAGTDVAKEASDIIITDDNYATIIKAVEEGRIIYDNLIKAVKYLLFGNLSEVGFIILSLLLALPLPLFPVQILWINLVTDGLPALALSIDPKDPSVMKRPPRDKTRKISDWQNLSLPIVSGVVVAIVSLFAYAYFLNSASLNQSRSFGFTLLIVLQMLYVFLSRKGRVWANKPLIISITLTLVLQYLILTVPTLQTIFKIEPFW